MESSTHIRRSFRPMPWLAAALVSGLAGSAFLFQSFAATASYSQHYPYGSADSCALINNQTFIYGWANDPEAGTGLAPYVQVIAGNNSQRVATNISGYRDAAINSYITKHFPNQPHYKEYGFQAVFSGLYKGTIYSISGTVYNVGAGSDHKLYIQNGGSVDGSNKPYFANSVIPDACLANKPAPPPPPPSPNPQPSPPPSDGSGGGSGSGSGSSNNTQPAGPASDADATITAGTTSATISVPAHDAAKIHVSYLPTGGVSTDTPDQNVSNGKVVIELHDLKPKTNYSFTITRANGNGASANSNAQNFTTPGFNISLSFVDKNDKPVKGIVATLNDANSTQATSDKNGKITFHNLDIGDYNVSFNYGGKQHIEQFSTDTVSANANANGQVITLNDVINVDDLVGGSGSTKLSKGSSFNPLIIVVLVVLIAAGVGVWWFIRRRASNQYGLAPAPAPQADIIDQASMKEFAKKQPPAGPPPEHMGQSLRDMVLQSMHEEAEKRKQQPPQEPPNPPQP